MKVDGWKYYNHAAITTTAPHEEPNLSAIEDGSVWKVGEGKSPMFARWTTGFDCDCETTFWYIIKEGPFDIETLATKARKHIRQSLKKVYVKKILVSEHLEELCAVHNRACQGYAEFNGSFVDETHFLNLNDSIECWGAFSSETDTLIGYMTCEQKNEYVETISAKYDPNSLNLRPSDAIHFTILEYYLNEKGYKYVCSGTRSINHVTNAQDYKISTFGFRKAFCRLHIVYNPKIRWMMKIIFPFRKILYACDKIKFIHQFNAVLKMEALARGKNE